MKIGFFGLGKMGVGMVSRILNDGHSVVGFDPYVDKNLISSLPSNFTLAQSEDELVKNVSEESVSCVWLMVPAGDIVDQCVDKLLNKLPANSIIVDGGNSNYQRSVANNNKCKDKNISFVDVGTSGGVWGLQNGFCLMVGGLKDSFDKIEPILKSLATEKGYAYLGDSGAGHYSKMVHNAIEYAMMQSYGEGVDLLENGPYQYDLHKLMKLWNHGSVIRSWLLELGEKMLDSDPKLDSLVGEIADSGTGKWSVEEALDRGIPIPVIAASLFNRYRSRRQNSISDRFIAGLRKAFGGHAVVKK